MFKLNYDFVALKSIHTGSDENNGTEKKLRREKVMLTNPVVYESSFKDVKDKRESFLIILYHIWKCIDFESMQDSRIKNIWNEFTSKLLASSCVRTKEQFLNTICNKMGIRTLSNDFSQAMFNEMQRFNDVEFLELIREELQYLVLMLKIRLQSSKDGSYESPLISYLNEPIRIKKTFELIPVISGNSIRGLLRRLAMYDFCQLTEIKGLDKNIYHQLFTGGNITGSTGKESLDNRFKFIEMCPMIGLFGSAIGNQTIEGQLIVGGASPKCLEHNNGDSSFWELIETKFQTRLDSSKTENIIDIFSDNNQVTSQMIYQYEVFVKGTVFNSDFAVKIDNELMISAFWRLMELYKTNPYICGNSARGNGLIQINIDIPENASNLYLDHLVKNKSEIQEYFRSKK